MPRSRGAAGLSLPLSLLPSPENGPVCSVRNCPAGALAMPSSEAQPFSSWGCKVIYQSGPKSQRGWRCFSACHRHVWGQGGASSFPSAQDSSAPLAGSKAPWRQGCSWEQLLNLNRRRGSLSQTQMLMLYYLLKPVPFRLPFLPTTSA